MSNSASTPVKVGQVWADNDKRSNGRIVTITAVDQTRASFSDGKRAGKALLHRFRPTSSGYRLVKDVADE